MAAAPAAAAPAAPAAPKAPKTIQRKTAGILAAAVLGMFGVHKFYMGKTKAGIITVLISVIGGITIVAPAAMLFIGVIEGITYLKMSDEQFKTTYLEGSKEWF